MNCSSFHPPARKTTAVRVLALLAALGFLSACATRTKEPSPGSGYARTLSAVERPGLATGWGDPRESWVEPTYFARASGDRPSGSDKLFYNDRAGVKAMLEYLVERSGGEPRPLNGLQPAARGLVRVGLRDGTGRWLDGFQLQDQRFAVGELHSRYEVVLKNETHRRVEVVLSVDGRDTLDGQSASVRKRGYILGPRETLAVDGFRITDGSVAAFHFTSVGDSYTQRRYAETNNVGLIGLAVFQERLFGTPEKPEHRAWRRGEPKDFPSSRRYATPPEA